MLLRDHRMHGAPLMKRSPADLSANLPQRRDLAADHNVSYVIPLALVCRLDEGANQTVIAPLTE
eukprot:1672625-Pleurochrysis_carterae.AAC.2